MAGNFTLAYIIFAIILLHLVAGFVWVFYKFMRKPKEKEEKITKDE